MATSDRLPHGLEQRLFLPREITVMIDLNKDGSTKTAHLFFEAQKNYGLTKAQRKDLNALMVSGADEVYYGEWLYKKVEDRAGMIQDGQLGRIPGRTIRYHAHFSAK